MAVVMRVAGLSGVAVLSAALAGCTPPPPAAPKVDVAAAAAEVRAAEAAFSAEFKARDSAKLLAHYADDATLSPPGVPSIHGIAGIKQAYAAILSDPTFTLSLTDSAIEVAASGDMAVSAGHYDQQATDPKTKKLFEEHGAYVTAFKKGPDGVWRIFQDIITPSGPDTPVK